MWTPLYFVFNLFYHLTVDPCTVNGYNFNIDAKN